MRLALPARSAGRTSGWLLKRSQSSSVITREAKDYFRMLGRDPLVAGVLLLGSAIISTSFYSVSVWM